MEHKEAAELLEAYALGALDKEELEALETHLKSGCRKCADTLKDLNELTSQLALVAPQRSPSPNLKEKIMTSIEGHRSDGDSPASPDVNEHVMSSVESPVPITETVSPKPRLAGWIVAGIAALLAIYFGIRTTSLKQKITEQHQDHAVKTEAESSRLKELQQHYAEIENENIQLKERYEKYAKVNEENLHLKGQLKKIKTEIALGFDKIRTLREKNSQLKEKVATLQQKNPESRNLPSAEKKQISNLKAQIARIHTEMMTLRKKLAETEDVTELIASPGTQFINLSGVDPHPHAFGKVVVDPIRGSAVLYVYQLPQPPDCMEYQLWVLREGKPTSAGVFKVGNDGSTVLKLNELSNPESIASFSVTIEPTGGLPTPTGMMYLTGP